jgi:hypothetical protein
MSDDHDHRDFRAHGDEEYAHLYRDPIDRYGQLPEWKRRWIEELTEEKIKDQDDATRFYHGAKAGGRFVKWLMITIVAVFVGAAAFGDAVQKLWHIVIRTGSP